MPPTFFAAQVSIAADFAIAETWTMTKQGDWNKVLQIKSTVPEVSRFSFVTFSIMPMNNEIANKFHDEKNVQWPDIRFTNRTFCRPCDDFFYVPQYLGKV